MFLALGLLFDLTDAARGVVLGLVLHLLEQQLLGAARREARGLLERALKLLLGLRDLRPFLIELGLLARQGLLAPGDGRGPLEHPGVETRIPRGSRIPAPHRLDGRRARGRAGGRRDPGAVHPAVDDGRKHDSHRDQRCGTDDFHGRSSPGGSGR
jgi:hypothetical protein